MKLNASDEPLTYNGNEEQNESGNYSDKIFTFMYQNIQCLRNKIGELEVFVKNGDHKQNIIYLTEHCLDNNELDNNKIDGYNMISSYARKDLQDGGYCIMVKQKYSYLED